MKGEHQQDGFRSSEERPMKYSAGEQAWDGISFSVSVNSALGLNRNYFNRTTKQPAFFVLREGGDNRQSADSGSKGVAGPCLVRSSEWLQRPELSALYNSWITCEDGSEADRGLRRIYYILRSAASEMLESSNGKWITVTLLQTPELSVRPSRLAALQDAQLEALFTALGEQHLQGCDCRLDLLAPYPASGGEFAAMREFIENVAEQTLGHAYAAACRIGAIIAPDAYHAAEEIVRIADFLVLEGAAGEPAPESDAAAEGFAQAAGQTLAAVRRVKPAAVVLAAGAPAASALADLYRIGLNGIFCSADQRTEALLRAACLTWMARQEVIDTAAGGRL